MSPRRQQSGLKIERRAERERRRKLEEAGGGWFPVNNAAC